MAVASKVVFSQKQPDPWDYDIGTMTGRTLNVVSPSFGGPAFVPRNINSIQSLTQHLGPERYNHIRHWNDELSRFTHSQGYHGLKNWLLNGGQNSTHLRVLGVGSNNTNEETGLTPGAGFKLSDHNYEMSFLFFKDSSLNGSLELGINQEEIDTTRFLHTLMFTHKDNVSEVEDIFDLINFQRGNLQIPNNQITNTETPYTKIHTREISQSNSNIYIHGQYRADSLTENTEDIEFLKSNDNENFDSFEYKYQTALTPWVTSQPYERSDVSAQDTSKIHEAVVNLFRFHSLDDGDSGNRFRIKVNPTNNGDINNNLYAKFDVYFYEYDPRDNSFRVLEKFESLDLNPESEDYIGRQIGTRHVYCDTTTKKIIDVGKYNNVSKYLRVEINDDIEYHKLGRQKELIPSGFRSYPHINFTNSLSTVSEHDYMSLPPKYRMNHTEFDVIDNKYRNEWGVEFYYIGQNNAINPSLNIISDLDDNDTSILGDKVIQVTDNRLLVSPYYFYTRFLPKNILTHEDNYLNSFFHLEKIKDTADIVARTYHPSGRITEGKFINLDNINISDNKYSNKLSFDFFTYGGFDGTNLLDHDKRYLTQRGISKEFYDENLKEESPTYSAYKLGIDIITGYENNNGDILAVPDTSHEVLNSYCVKKCEDLGRYIFVGDAKGLYVDTLQTTDYFNFNSFDYYNIKKEFINYSLNKSAQQEEFYTLNDIKENVYDNILSLELNPKYRSRYNFQTLGCIKANLLSEMFYVSPVNYVLSIIASDSVRTTKVLKTINYSILNESLNIEVANLFPSDQDENKIEEKFDKIRINPLRLPIAGNLQLNSDMTTYDNKESLFCQVKEVEAIQEIKKRIVNSLYTDTSVIPNTFFFNSSSSTNNLYQDVTFQLNNVLESLKQENIIENYSLQIDRNYFIANRDDVNNYRFKGNVVIQLVGDESDERTQSIELNDLLGQLGQFLPASDTSLNTRNLVF